jgi:hypothetical protein
VDERQTGISTFELVLHASYCCFSWLCWFSAAASQLSAPQAHQCSPHLPSVMQLFTSRDDKKHWARAIAMMRHGFGGHKYGHDPATVRERRQGQIGDFIRD